MQNILNFTLSLVSVYVLAIMFTLVGVVAGGIDTNDASVWSEHVRSIIGIIIN